MEEGANGGKRGGGGGGGWDAVGERDSLSMMVNASTVHHSISFTCEDELNSVQVDDAIGCEVALRGRCI